MTLYGGRGEKCFGDNLTSRLPMGIIYNPYMIHVIFTQSFFVLKNDFSTNQVYSAR